MLAEQIATVDDVSVLKARPNAQTFVPVTGNYVQTKQRITSWMSKTFLTLNFIVRTLVPIPQI